MLTFTPKTDEELIDLLEPGDADFKVVDAIFKYSKTTNNPMIELLLKVWDKKGQEGLINDYLMLTDSKYSHRKIKHFCHAVGLEVDYQQGQLDPNRCKERAGKVRIKIQSDKTGKYPDKNAVLDYLLSKESNSSIDDLNDDIPFL